MKNNKTTTKTGSTESRTGHSDNRPRSRDDIIRASERPSSSPDRDVDRDIRQLTEQLNRSRPEQPEAVTDETARNIITSLRSNFDLLTSQDKHNRKVGLAYIKSLRSQIEHLDESMLADREKYMKVIDTAVDHVSTVTGQIGVMTSDIRNDLLKQLPTIKELKTSFINGFSPLSPFIMNVMKDVKDWKKTASQKAKESFDRAASSIEKLKDDEQHQQQPPKQTPDTSNEAEQLPIDIKPVVDKLDEQQNILQSIEKVVSHLPNDAVETKSIERVDVAPSPEPRSADDQQNKPIDKKQSNNTKGERLQKKLTQKQISILDAANKLTVDQGSIQTKILERVADNTFKLLDIAEKQLAEQQQNTLQALKEQGEKSKAVSPIEKIGEEKDSGSGGILGMISNVKGFGWLAKLLKGGKGLVGGIMSLIGLDKLGEFLKGADKVGDVAKIGAEAADVGKLSKFLKVGKIAGKLFGKLSLIGTVLFALWDFADGMFDAEKILGKENVDFRDRVSAGIGSMLGGIVGIIDDVGEMIGVDTTIGGKKLGEWVKLLTAKGWSMILHPIDTFNELSKQVSDWWSTFSVSDLVGQITTVASDMFNCLKDMVVDFFRSQVKGLTSLIPDAFIPDMVKKFVDTPSSRGIENAKQEDKISAIDNVKQYVVDKEASTSQPPDANTTIAPTNNNNIQNNSVAYNVPAPIRTLNDDASIRTRLGFA